MPSHILSSAIRKHRWMSTFTGNKSLSDVSADMTADEAKLQLDVFCFESVSSRSRSRIRGKQR